MASGLKINYKANRFVIIHGDLWFWLLIYSRLVYYKTFLKGSENVFSAFRSASIKNYIDSTLLVGANTLFLHETHYTTGLFPILKVLWAPSLVEIAPFGSECMRNIQIFIYRPTRTCIFIVIDRTASPTFPQSSAKTLVDNCLELTCPTLILNASNIVLHFYLL